MPKVEDDVSHILHHISAVATKPEPDAIPGIEARAQKMRDMLTPLKTDQRDLTRKQLLVEFKKVMDVDVKDALELIPEDDDGVRVRLALASWVEFETVEY